MKNFATGSATALVMISALVSSCGRKNSDPEQVQPEASSIPEQAKVEAKKEELKPTPAPTLVQAPAPAQKHEAPAAEKPQPAAKEPTQSQAESEKKLDRLKAYQDAFAYAFSSLSDKGLNLYRDEAMAFAEKISHHPEPYVYLQNFKDAFAFAFNTFSDKGLNLYRDEAMVLAHKFARKKESKKILAEYQRSFAYAFSTFSEGGLNLYRDEAMSFADKKSGLSDATK